MYQSIRTAKLNSLRRDKDDGLKESYYAALSKMEEKLGNFEDAARWAERAGDFERAWKLRGK
ncbi:MAG: hypothetical protein ACREBF_04420 [Candidatus Micrarchaeales archaeon]